MYHFFINSNNNSKYSTKIDLKKGSYHLLNVRYGLVVARNRLVVAAAQKVYARHVERASGERLHVLDLLVQLVRLCEAQQRHV